MIHFHSFFAISFIRRSLFWRGTFYKTDTNLHLTDSRGFFPLFSSWNLLFKQFINSSFFFNSISFKILFLFSLTKLLLYYAILFVYFHYFIRFRLYLYLNVQKRFFFSPIHDATIQNKRKTIEKYTIFRIRSLNNWLFLLHFIFFFLKFFFKILFITFASHVIFTSHFSFGLTQWNSFFLSRFSIFYKKYCSFWLINFFLFF